MSRYGPRGIRRRIPRMAAERVVQTDDEVEAVIQSEAAVKAQADGKRRD